MAHDVRPWSLQDCLGVHGGDWAEHQLVQYYSALGMSRTVLSGCGIFTIDRLRRHGVQTFCSDFDSNRVIRGQGEPVTEASLEKCESDFKIQASAFDFSDVTACLLMMVFWIVVLV